MVVVGSCPDANTLCGRLGVLMWPLFAAYIVTQMIYVSSLLRSWDSEPGGSVWELSPNAWVIGRLLAYVVVLAIPLATAGLFPVMMTNLANLPDAIPRGAGNPPSAVASWQVWLTLAGPLTSGNSSGNCPHSRQRSSQYQRQQGRYPADASVMVEPDSPSGDTGLDFPSYKVGHGQSGGSVGRWPGDC